MRAASRSPREIPLYSWDLSCFFVFFKWCQPLITQQHGSWTDRLKLCAPGSCRGPRQGPPPNPLKTKSLAMRRCPGLQPDVTETSQGISGLPCIYLNGPAGACKATSRRDRGAHENLAVLAVPKVRAVARNPADLGQFCMSRSGCMAFRPTGCIRSSGDEQEDSPPRHVTPPRLHASQPAFCAESHVLGSGLDAAGGSASGVGWPVCGAAEPPAPTVPR